MNQRHKSEWTMIRVRQIDHINMRVRNLAESIEFYQRLFSFEMKEDHRGDAKEPWAIIGLAGVAYLCMYEHSKRRIEPEALKINHFGLVVEDIEKTLEQLRSQGVEVLYDGLVDWPRSRSIYIRDPNGYEIELAEKVGGGLDDPPAGSR